LFFLLILQLAFAEMAAAAMLLAFLVQSAGPIELHRSSTIHSMLDVSSDVLVFELAHLDHLLSSINTI
jgi:hypothetical protein